MTDQLRNLEVDRAVYGVNNQHQMVEVYRALIEKERTGATVPWSDVNAVIVERWSESGLKDIKAAAWRKS